MHGVGANCLQHATVVGEARPSVEALRDGLDNRRRQVAYALEVDPLDSFELAEVLE